MTSISDQPFSQRPSDKNDKQSDNRGQEQNEPATKPSFKVFETVDGPFSARIIEGLDPQSLAMVQALKSRDPSSITVHLDMINEKGSARFMSHWYLKYGHKSIGDCAPITLSIEGVSTVFAKYIEDSRLFNGQETSTRYVNFAKSYIVDPIGTPESKLLQQRLLDFYNKSMKPLQEYIAKQHPKKDTTQEVYDRTVAAKAFDILRAFIPAGMTTNLTYTTNFRQAYERFHTLSFSPCQIIAKQAKQILDLLVATYPTGFAFKATEPDSEYKKLVAASGCEFAKTHPNISYDWQVTKRYTVAVDVGIESVKSYEKIIDARPHRSELPPKMEDLGQVHVYGMLDFGSWRDLQRHRSAVIRMPVLDPRNGFHEWYYSQMPADMSAEARALIETTFASISTFVDLTNANEISQYYCPLGTIVPVQMTCGLPSLTYILELRTEKTVHATLREFCIAVYKELIKESKDLDFPRIIKYINLENDAWDVRRGTQTIEKRQT